MIFNVIRLVMVVVAIGLPGTSVWGQDRYAITGIQARLFFHGTGEIGTVDLLYGREHALWNTFIGEGDAGKPSSAAREARHNLDQRVAAALPNYRVPLASFFT
jgi:hypothetical protein